MISVTDDFTTHLVNIAKKVVKDPAFQTVCMGLLRSDYMVDKNTSQMLQIELNTISCSFLGVEEKLSQLHHFLLASHPSDLPAIASFMNVPVEDLEEYANAASANQTLQKTAASLAEAASLYNQR